VWDERTRDARAQPEEIVVKALRRNHDQRHAVLTQLAHQVGEVVVSPLLHSIRHALEGAHAMHFLEVRIVAHLIA
jgi:hypothetical protein